MSGISSINGQVVSLYKDKYFNGDDVIEFIEKLKQEM